jgi:hypothetical protein
VSARGSCITYRIRLHEPDGWAVVEQSLYCYVSDGGIRNLDL